MKRGVKRVYSLEKERMKHAKNKSRQIDNIKIEPNNISRTILDTSKSRDSPIQSINDGSTLKSRDLGLSLLNSNSHLPNSSKVTIKINKSRNMNISKLAKK